MHLSVQLHLFQLYILKLFCKHFLIFFVFDHPFVSTPSLRKDCWYWTSHPPRFAQILRLEPTGVKTETFPLTGFPPISKFNLLTAKLSNFLSVVDVCGEIEEFVCCLCSEFMRGYNRHGRRCDGGAARTSIGARNSDIRIFH